MGAKARVIGALFGLGIPGVDVSGRLGGLRY
jgi:hypothetical protein